MKDLLVGLVEYIFSVDFDDDIKLKKLVIVLTKVIVFIAFTTLIIWILIHLKK